MAMCIHFGPFCSSKKGGKFNISEYICFHFSHDTQTLWEIFIEAAVMAAALLLGTHNSNSCVPGKNSSLTLFLSRVVAASIQKVLVATLMIKSWNPLIVMIRGRSWYCFDVVWLWWCCFDRVKKVLVTTINIKIISVRAFLGSFLQIRLNHFKKHYSLDLL